ncbi:MAG: DEAD/DEAH box helicase [Thermoanaerobaculia bacterium]|nr:DEAD/DEAH box helicase [Thermoanaerobaculia bacterium]
MSQNRSKSPSGRPRRGAKQRPHKKKSYGSARRADQQAESESRRRLPEAARRSRENRARSFASGAIDNNLPGFAGFGLDGKLLRGIDAMGFREPTPIQKMGVVPAVQGRDVLACAMTGSGKTASFLLPILQRLLKTRPRRIRAVRALVLTPTRELAAQVVQQFEDLGKFTKLRAAAVFGGVGMRPQERAFHSGVDLMVACPGRLLDHLSRPYADLEGLEVLVLDEVDRMLDMGFLPDVRRILQRIPSVEQTLCYSATMPRDIVELTAELQNDPIKLQVERQSKPAEGVRQTVFPVHESGKRELLVHLLEGSEIFNALVFTRTKYRADRLAQYLSKNGVSAERIHGNRSQAQRTRALDRFKKGKARVLVATDVAARGIDVDELSHVVNFDVPNVPEDYIHRVGRTARARRTGDAYSFVSPKEEVFVRGIEKALGETLSRRHPDGSVTPGSKHPGTEARGQQSSDAPRGRQHSQRHKPAASAKQGKGQQAGRGRKKTSGGGQRRKGEGRKRSRGRQRA